MCETRMPVKRKMKRKQMKRKRGRSMGILTRSIPGGINQIFPDRITTKLRTVVSYTLGSAGPGGNSACGILGNALHSPVAAATNTSGFLTFTTANTISGLGALIGPGQASSGVLSSTAPYSAYRIIASSISLQIQNVSSATNDACDVILFPQYLSLFGVENVTSQTILGLCEKPGAKNVQISGQTFNRGVTMRHYMSTARQFGLKYKWMVEGSEYSGGINSNPLNAWAWGIYMIPASASYGVFLNVIATVEYTIEFFVKNQMVGYQP